jgi:hypothetical protein
MFSVAFITQYGMFVWFVGGVAVSLWYLSARRRTDGLELFPDLQLDGASPGAHTATSTVSARP